MNAMLRTNVLALAALATMTSVLPSALAATTPAAPAAVEGTNGSSSTTKLPADPLIQSAPKTDEADELITNRQLRASTGSLSKFSFNTTWSYSAGAVNAPFDISRPNITAAGDTAALQSLSADVGMRYRIDTKNSANLSVGLAMVAPFHYSIDTQDPALQGEYDQNAHALTVNDPTITLRHLDKFWGIQSVTQLSGNLYTAAYRRNAGFRTGFVLSENLMYEIGKSGLSFGTFVSGTINTFGGDVDSGNRPAFILGFYPAIEYVVSERVNLRTVSGVWVHEFRRNGTGFDRIIYQSVGVGFSVTRDIFLYPNIQFLPGSLRADKTNLGFTANINLL